MAGTTQAQDTITNAAQFTTAFDQPGLSYPLVSPFEGTFQPMATWFVDFFTVTNAVAAITNYDGEVQNGITVWPMRLVQSAETGEVVVKAGTNEAELLRLDAPTGFVPYATYAETLRMWALLFGDGYTSYSDLVANGCTFLDPPKVVMDVLVVSAADEDAYFSDGSSVGQGGFMIMSDDEGDSFGDVDPCNITNIFQGFAVTGISLDANREAILTWQACTNFLYGVLSTDELSTNTFWMWRTYLFGLPNSMTWTDTTTTATNIVNRFYKVVRKLPVAIAAGGSHSLALTADHKLWAWGADDQYQLGDGRTTDEPAPEPIENPLCGPANLTNAVALAGGSDFSMAVDANGVVWSWGDGSSYGQLGNGAYTNVFTPTPISGISNVVSVAAGYGHALALRADGTVWAWGDNVNGADDSGNGQLGAGDLGGAGLTNSPVRSLVPTGTVIVAIAAGDRFSLALDATGLIWGWGSNEGGELGANPPPGSDVSTNLPALVAGISNVIAIAAGYDHAIAVKADQTLWTWGDNFRGELGRTGSNTVPGQVVANGLSNNVVGIAGGFQFTLAVTSNGQVYAFGDNSAGQLGTNGISLTNAPMLVAGISNVVLVSAHPDGEHSLAVTVNQGTYQYYAWGANDRGQVGNGDATGDNQYTPVQLHFCDACTSCIQLGTGGVFTAQCTGTLKLYFNDGPEGFGNNLQSYTATVVGLATNVTVMATNGRGVAVGIVTNGGVYAYSASGQCGWDVSCSPCLADANGNDTNGVPWTCSSANPTTCPDLQCYSLVGRIQ